MNNKFNKRYIITNKLFIIFLSIISLFYFVIGEKFVPDKFHFDSDTIREGMLNPTSVSKSYRSTSNFFNYIGLKYNTPQIVLIILSWLVFIFLLIIILKINNYKKFSTYQIGLLLFFMLMYGFYFTSYSKDILVLIFLGASIILPNIHNNVLINIILAIIIYGFFFREYWILIGIISLIPLMIKDIKIKKDIIYIFFAIILFMMLYHFIKHGDVTDIRININSKRLDDPNAKSMIHNLVPSVSIFNDITNYVYVLISLIIPIQGFPSVNMIIYYLWIWMIILFAIKHNRSIDFKVMLILIIYINIQALFEPDFGSVFRHQLAWFPILCYALFSNSKLIKDKD